MKVGFGKHNGKSVETIILKEPSYIEWALAQASSSGTLARLKGEAQRLIAIFDAKPYRTKCYGHGCSKLATRCSVYLRNVYGPMWWCDDCDPYQRGADDGKLSVVRTYRDALEHCTLFCTNRSAVESLVRALAQAKGLPQRVSEKQSAEFFKP